MMPEKLDSSIVLLRERIEQGMRGSADLILDEFELAGVKGLAFMFDGLVSNTQVSDFLLRPINRMAPPEADPEKLWESNIFGKSLHDLMNEGLQNKLYKMPVEARMKLQEALERVINEGCNGLICFIL